MAYDYIKPDGGDTGTLLNIQKRLAFIQSYLDIQGIKIVDCGCGTGQYLLVMLSRGADVHGVEYDQGKVLKFKQENPKISERVYQGSVEAMRYESGSFDLALLNEVLEHVPNETNALHEIHRVLKPKGLLIIFSPNRLYPFETHTVTLKNTNRQLPITTPFIPYIPLWLGQKIFEYKARNYWPNELRQKVRASGFTIIGVNYIWQTFENVSGIQPKGITLIKPILQKIFVILENVPFIKVLGVSQVVIAQK